MQHRVRCAGREGRHRMWTMSHRTGTALVAVAALLACAGAAWPETYASRPVDFIVPYSAGGTVDTQLRALASATEKHLGQPIVMKNRPSANGTLAAAFVATSALPDGYTITQIHAGVLREPSIRRTPYDPA